MKLYRLEDPDTGEAIDRPVFLTIAQARAAAYEVPGGAIVVESPEGSFAGAQGPWRAKEWAMGARCWTGARRGR